jgi:hypothetical protein
MTLSKFTPSMEYSTNLEPARNLMETVLWRFGDYSYCEFIGCVVILGVVAVPLAYAEKERGGRSWHLWIGGKLQELVGQVLIMAAYLWKPQFWLWRTWAIVHRPLDERRLA